jgi:hypothetical protein
MRQKYYKSSCEYIMQEDKYKHLIFYVVGAY